MVPGPLTRGRALEEAAAHLRAGRLGPAESLARRPDRWRLRIWAVVLEPGGHQRAHMHPSAWLSGVHYARLPESLRHDSGDSGAKAGWLEFGRPGPEWGLAAPPRVRQVRPAEGSMVLFPAYLHHRTLPFSDSAPRISLAFDVIPRA